MTLTKSYHNSFRQWWSVYTWSLKKQSGIGIIYLILLCLALPFLLGIILFSSIKNQHMLTGENIANGLHILFTFLIIPGTLLFVFIMHCRFPLLQCFLDDFKPDLLFWPSQWSFAAALRQLYWFVCKGQQIY